MMSSILNRLLPVAVGLTISACNPIPSHVSCNLPDLMVNSQVTSINTIGTWGVYQNYCPKPIERVFAVKRAFGSIKFEWWGSPHRLYMTIEDSSEGPLLLAIESPILTLEKVNIERGWLSQYSSRITFPNNDSTAPILPEAKFDLLIKNADGDIVDKLEMHYSVKECTCTSVDSI